jgi:hypothetical protein
MKLPIQSAPIERKLVCSPHVVGADAASPTYLSGIGLETSQTVCDNLTGLAQQYCFALEYGITT